MRLYEAICQSPVTKRLWFKSFYWLVLVPVVVLFEDQSEVGFTVGLAEIAFEFKLDQTGSCSFKEGE